MVYVSAGGWVRWVSVRQCVDGYGYDGQVRQRVCVRDDDDDDDDMSGVDDVRWGRWVMGGCMGRVMGAGYGCHVGTMV